MSKSCGIEFPHFGASYPDARCCNGYLWDMDSWDESLGGFTLFATLRNGLIPLLMRSLRQGKKRWLMSNS